MIYEITAIQFLCMQQLALLCYAMYAVSLLKLNQEIGYYNLPGHNLWQLQHKINKMENTEL